MFDTDVNSISYFNLVFFLCNFSFWIYKVYGPDLAPFNIIQLNSKHTETLWGYNCSCLYYGSFTFSISSSDCPAVFSVCFVASCLYVSLLVRNSSARMLWSKRIHIKLICLIKTLHTDVQPHRDILTRDQLMASRKKVFVIKPVKKWLKPLVRVCTTLWEVYSYLSSGSSGSGAINKPYTASRISLIVI